MIPDQMQVMLDGHLAGLLRMNSDDTLSFTYDDGWRSRENAYPLSLSMPLFESQHSGAPVRAYLEGLLPDRDAVLRSWARHYHVSPNNPYALLSVVGEDCPGAVQFISNRDAREPSRGDGWLDESEIAQLLRNAVRMYDTGSHGPAGAYFSLAGAQPKIVLYRDGERWAQTSERLASTVLLKPAAMNLEHIALNEHLCMIFAAELGIPTARTELRQFEDQVALVAWRFDRVQHEGSVTRIHQEDFCQAMGVGPSRRYEFEGGPSAADCARLLIRYAADPDADLPAFIDALALNRLIFGTDAHAKNFALVYYGPTPSLAPLYDIISILPYPTDVHPRKARLAMRIGGEYRPRQVLRRHWESFAREIQVDEGPVVDRVHALIADAPSALERVRERAAEDRLDTTFTEKLLGAISREVPVVLRGLESRSTNGAVITPSFTGGC